MMCFHFVLVQQDYCEGRVAYPERIDNSTHGPTVELPVHTGDADDN